MDYFDNKMNKFLADYANGKVEVSVTPEPKPDAPVKGEITILPEHPGLPKGYKRVDEDISSIKKKLADDGFKPSDAKRSEPAVKSMDAAIADLAGQRQMPAVAGAKPKSLMKRLAGMKKPKAKARAKMGTLNDLRNEERRLRNWLGRGSKAQQADVQAKLDRVQKLIKKQEERKKNVTEGVASWFKSKPKSTSKPYVHDSLMDRLAKFNAGQQVSPIHAADDDDDGDEPLETTKLSSSEVAALKAKRAKAQAELKKLRDRRGGKGKPFAGEKDALDTIAHVNKTLGEGWFSRKPDPEVKHAIDPENVPRGWTKAPLHKDRAKTSAALAKRMTDYERKHGSLDGFDPDNYPEFKDEDPRARIATTHRIGDPESVKRDRAKDHRKRKGKWF